MKITRIRLYQAEGMRESMFNQSEMVVTVETDDGLVGIGEGGAKDTVEACAAMVIGQDAGAIEYLWQRMYRGAFYPAGREKLHALGGIDLALWDIKGKSLGVPVYSLLGGPTRKYMECYATGFPRQGSISETARACVEAGFRAYRAHGADPEGGVYYNSRQMVQKIYEHCVEIKKGVGEDGDWSIDFHTRLDLADAIRLCGLIEDLNPYFVEDLIRSENPGVYRTLRQQVKVPIALGEQFGDRWDINEMIEQHLIDYTRVTLPNVGGLTEFMKIAAICETHYVGMIPHFTGPISTAALVHACGAFSGPVMMELTGDGTKTFSWLPQVYDFKDGKLWLNDRPGFGVTFDAGQAELIAEITEPSKSVRGYQRPDGSYTNW